jgi:hypothetical protein
MKKTEAMESWSSGVMDFREQASHNTPLLQYSIIPKGFYGTKS